MPTDSVPLVMAVLGQALGKAASHTLNEGQVGGLLQRWAKGEIKNDAANQADAALRAIAREFKSDDALSKALTGDVYVNGWEHLLGVHNPTFTETKLNSLWGELILTQFFKPFGGPHSNNCGN